MKVSKGGNYVKADPALRGKVVKFLNEGEIELSDKYEYDDGTPVKSFVFDVEIGGERKRMRVNKASKVAMMEAFGDETKDWIGKEAKIIIMPTPNGENKMIVLEPVNVKGWDEPA